MPLMVTRLSLHSSVLFSPMPETPSCPPGGAVVGPPGVLGMLGTLMLGMVTPGKSGIDRADLPPMNHPTIPAKAMKTTAAMPKIAHGIPADDLRGGGAHGAP